MKLNDIQQKAVYEPLGKNILVSAAAGSGKTRVLVERILHLLGTKTKDEKVVSLSNMVIMTFTKKATGEMKKKIKDAIENRIKGEKDSEKLKFLIRESEILASSNISTIDSFCKRILEENYEMLSEENSVYGTFDPAYRIADEKELGILYSDVLDDLLERKYADEKYRDLFDAYIEKCNESTIKDMILDGFKTISSIPWPDEELKNRIKNFEAESIAINEKYIQSKIEELKKLKTESRSLLDDFYDVLEESRTMLTELGKTKLSTYQSVCTLIESTMPAIAAILDTLSSTSYSKDECKEICEKVAMMPKFSAPAKSHVHVRDAEGYKELVDKCKMLIADIEKVYELYEILCLPRHILINNNEKILLELLYEFYMEVVKVKKAKNLFAIGDYANLSLDILYDKSTDENGNAIRVVSGRAMEIAEKYTAIFIDEYQDTNYIQEKILYAITSGFAKKNVFMVGDIKQSIYGFRNAEPSIFYEKYKNYKEDTSDDMLINLNANYRSRIEILKYVNDLFSKIMHKEYGDVDYKNEGMLGEPVIDEEDKVEYKEKKVIGKKGVEIDLITKNETVDDDEEDMVNETVDNLSYEADFVARKAKSLVDAGECSYKDIVVLLRSTKGRAEYFLDAFAKYGIPAYSELNKGFFNRFEIKLMISMLRIIDNPIQNIELASVLTSPIFDIKNKDLALIKVIYQEAVQFGKKDKFMLYDAIRYFIDNHDTYVSSYKEFEKDIDVLYEKITYFDKVLADLTFKSRYLSISELINAIFEVTDIKKLVSSMVDGRMRVANLDILYQNARGYENSSYVGLFNFLRYVEKILLREDDQGQAKLLDENDDVVRIMTIHTSKGLEFPVVFLANAIKPYNNDDAMSRYYFSKDFGLALHYIDKNERYMYPTPKLKYARKLTVDKQKEEEMRMLYVALTRAESKLYITSFVKNGKIDAKTFNSAKIEKLKSDIENGTGVNADYDINHIKGINNYLDFIVENYPYGKDFCTINHEEMDKDLDMTPMVVDEKDTNISDKEDAYVYRYDVLKSINPKFSVSDIKQISKENASPKKSYIISTSEESESQSDDARVDGTVQGTAYHRYMQFYDYNENKFLSNGENETCVDIVKTEKIQAFLESTVGKKMAAAYKNKTLYREHKFMKLLSIDEINTYINDKSISFDEKNVIVQGIIDAFLIEKDEDGNDYIVLIDYKTDGMAKENLDREVTKKYLIKNYKVQLDIYGKVLFELTGIPVKETYIYSFALDEGIKL